MFQRLKKLLFNKLKHFGELSTRPIIEAYDLYYGSGFLQIQGNLLSNRRSWSVD